jgi:hypothetical protein
MSKPLPGPPTPDPRAPAIAAHLQKRSSERVNRLALLKRIEQERKSTVISYVTSSRGALGAQIGNDTIRIFREHLGRAGKVEQLDLLLITRGGNTLTPLRLVSLLREYSKRICVLVPYMAHSAGTLIALGADEVVMGAMGELGPVDPSVANHFNPIQATEDIQGTTPKPRPRIPISVEDVTSYLSFAQSHAHLDAAGMASAYSTLTANVHPLALGNILRNHNLIRHLARRLLSMHMEAGETERIDAIVKTLTEELYSHSYLITRDEAPKLGLKVVAPSVDVEESMWNLFKLYEGHLGIDREINWGNELGAEKQKYLCYDVAVVESANLLNSFSYRGLATRKGQNEFEFNAEFQAWEQ